MIGMPRRSLVAALATLPLLARGAEPAADAAAFVKQAGAELAAAVGGASSAPDKRARLAAYLGRVVDEDGLARFCLGRYWQLATQAQRDEYGRLFRQLLLRGVVNRLGDYQTGQVSIVVDPVLQRPDGLYVPTVVERAGNSPVRITWLVTTDAGGLRIADVVAEGMSLRQTQRSDYASFLARNGGNVDALIAAMRERLGE